MGKNDRKKTCSFTTFYALEDSFGMVFCSVENNSKNYVKMEENRRNFEKRLDQLLQKTSYREKALRFQQLLDTENGAADACKWILQQANRT